ncbi:MAG TPA: PGPGW domain-containing protein [Thermoanaerobaculia bacterium]|nr:PGPGW domain-containing protein [Thermoanaerobaculia bacterium]
MAQGTCEEIETEPATAPPALADRKIPMTIGEDTLVRQRRLQRPLPLWLRVVVLLVGWVVLLVGVAGLVLPGIQGVVTILLGAAILSVASELAHQWMRKALQRWPKLLSRVDGFRDKIYDKLHRMVSRE